MKLISNVDSPIDLRTASTEHERANFLSYIDGVGNVRQEVHSFNRLKKIAKMSAPYTQLLPEMYLEANSWLEQGNRIEDYLPWLSTTFEMDWKITIEDQNKAWNLLKRDCNNIVVYTSHTKYNSMKNLVGKWTMGRWKQIIRGIYSEIPDANVIWLGAEYDEDMLKFLSEDFPIVPAVGLPAPVVISLLRGCTGFLAYQSGLSIISICENIPTLMIYFDELEPMVYSFCPKSSIGDDQIYKPTYFSELNDNPDIAIEWTKGLLV